MASGEVIKVLIVDDIPETRTMLRKLLAFETDVEVVADASTGREGLEAAAEYKPDVILMDINMPDMDGITATERIKKVLPAAAIVMMSVQSEADYLRRAMMAGARDFLTKPISGENLYETIRRVYDMMADQRLAASKSGSPSAGQAAGGTGVLEDSGHVIAVYSPQGGAGVTTIATNIAVALMREGTRVLLIDTDLQFGDVGVFLNLNSKHTLVDLSESVSDFDEDLAENVMVTHGSGLKVLLGPHSPEEAERILREDLVAVISNLKNRYDYIIIDMAHKLDDMLLDILDQAERIVLVATPTLPSIKNVRLMLDIFQAMEYEQDKIMFVMNRVNTDARGRAAIPIDAIENNLKRTTEARIPLDERTFLSAVNQGVSVIAGDPTRSPAKDLLDLANAVRRSVAEDDDQIMEEEPEPARRRSRP